MKELNVLEWILTQSAEYGSIKSNTQIVINICVWEDDLIFYA